MNNNSKNAFERLKKIFSGKKNRDPNQRDNDIDDQNKNQSGSLPKYLKIYTIGTAIIASVITIYLVEYNIWPATRFIQYNNDGSATKWSFVLVLLIVYIPFQLFKYILKWKFRKKDKDID